MTAAIPAISKHVRAGETIDLYPSREGSLGLAIDSFHLC